jgi:hypothetical protein
VLDILPAQPLDAEQVPVREDVLHKPRTIGAAAGSARAP